MDVIGSALLEGWNINVSGSHNIFFNYSQRQKHKQWAHNSKVFRQDVGTYTQM